MVTGRHHDVERLGYANLEFVDRNWPNILAVRLDNGHCQARNANVEIGLGGGVDDAQPNPFPGLEQAGPVVERTKAIDGKIVGGPGHIRNVGGVHSHLGPIATFRSRKVAPSQLA